MIFSTSFAFSISLDFRFSFFSSDLPSFADFSLLDKICVVFEEEEEEVAAAAAEVSDGIGDGGWMADVDARDRFSRSE